MTVERENPVLAAHQKAVNAFAKTGYLIAINKEQAQIILQGHGLAEHEGFPILDAAFIESIVQVFPDLRRDNYYDGFWRQKSE